MNSLIRPGTGIALRLPSDLHKLIEIKPDTTISLGKYGSFSSNDLLGRPYYLTYEILDKPTSTSSLRIVSVSELRLEEAITDDVATPSESRDDTPSTPVLTEAVADPRNNRLTVDDPTRQSLSMDDIEALKASDSGRSIVSKIMASHSHLNEKTAYSLAKYTLRKQKKYMKRFTALPIDVGFLCCWMLSEKEPMKTMELRQEHLGLIGSWANVMCGEGGIPEEPKGRWLAVEDAAGLVVALMAERMDILQSRDDSNSDAASSPIHKRPTTNNSMPSPQNTITLVHSATQPNLSLLTYFGFDSNNTTPSNQTPHPLHTHLKTLSWLQLLHPEEDVTYAEPAPIPEDELQKMKSGKRGAHRRKRRRWAHCKAIVDQTRSGQFDGLILATYMSLLGVLHHLVPLLRGAAPIVIYSPNVEPLIDVMDAYGSGRKTAFLHALDDGEDVSVPSEDFPVDPRLVLAPSLQTARAREWQVLPGRTHPVMTMRGGAEGYFFTGTRVLPAEGRIEARGNFMKRRKKAGEVADVDEGEKAA